MITLVYMGKHYPHEEALQRLNALGYRLGLLHDNSLKMPSSVLFDWIEPVDFSTEERFIQSLDCVTETRRIDGILCPYENYILFKALAAKKIGLNSLSVESARACTDKIIMRTMFSEFDKSITPAFARVSSINDLISFANAHTFPIILKPTNLVKSLLITTCYSIDELVSAYKATISVLETTYKRQHVTARTPGLIVEEFMTGKLCSVAAFVDKDGIPHFCPGVTSLQNGRDVGYDDNFIFSRTLPTKLSTHIESMIFATASRGIAALKLSSSAAHIEIMYDDDKARIIEIGARIGGYRQRMYENSYRLDLIEQEARISTGKIPIIRCTFLQYCAIYEIFPKQIGIFERMTGLEASDHYSYFHQTAESGDTIGLAKDGFRAAAVIGITDKDKTRFTKECCAINHIDIQTR